MTFKSLSLQQTNVLYSDLTPKHLDPVFPMMHLVGLNKAPPQLEDMSDFITFLCLDLPFGYTVFYSDFQQLDLEEGGSYISHNSHVRLNKAPWIICTSSIMYFSN